MIHYIQMHMYMTTSFDRN